VNRSDLVLLLAQHTQLPKKRVEQAVHLVLGSMISALAEGQRIEIRGFGTFSSKVHPARQSQDPRNGSRRTVAAKRRPLFRPSPSALPDGGAQ
jgi:integration host factor subunit beta